MFNRTAIRIQPNCYFNDGKYVLYSLSLEIKIVFALCLVRWIGIFLFFTQSQTIAFRIDFSIRIHFIHRLFFESANPTNK